MTSVQRFEPNILGFLCNWCCYAGADLAGVSRYQYPPNIRIIRLMCSGRVDPAFIFRAFLNGEDGVFIGGCWLGECHYLTQGNYDALSMMHLSKKLLEQIGIHPDRLRLEWVSASEGIRFAEVITDFTNQLKEMGPVGIVSGENINKPRLKLKAVISLVPYIKLVERERINVHFDTEEEYRRYFNSTEFERIFKESILDKLRINQIMMLLREKSLTAGEISEALDLNLSEVLEYLSDSVGQALVDYDENRKYSVTVQG